jgi:hypothetical protein
VRLAIGYWLLAVGFLTTNIFLIDNHAGAGISLVQWLMMSLALATYLRASSMGSFFPLISYFMMI